MNSLFTKFTKRMREETQINEIKNEEETLQWIPITFRMLCAEGAPSTPSANSL